MQKKSKVFLKKAHVYKIIYYKSYKHEFLNLDKNLDYFKSIKFQ
jgi:hypothetical protein